MRKLKVYGGITSYVTEGSARYSIRTIVAAATKKRMVEMLNESKMRYSAYEFNNWFVATGNTVELSVATEEGIWSVVDKGIRTAEDYKRIK
jgi:hypothetical protein